MDRDTWDRVDAYFADRLIKPGESLDEALAANAAAGLPPIDVSPLQGKFLSLVAQAIGARRVLEIGTLGGFSTIWLARGVGEEGKVISLEFQPRYAEVARANVARAGLADRVDIRVGAALETLPLIEAEGGGPFDLVFIDADKVNQDSLCRLGPASVEARHRHHRRQCRPRRRDPRPRKPRIPPFRASALPRPPRRRPPPQRDRDPDGRRERLGRLLLRGGGLAPSSGKASVPGERWAP